MNKVLISVLAVSIAFLASSVAAQTVQVQVVPPNPTVSDEVFLRFEAASQWIGGSLTRTGNHLRLDLAGCPILCYPVLDISLGQLAPGTYTYEIYSGSNLVASGQFQVVHIISLLSPAALAILGALLGLAGVWMLSRYNFL